MYHRSLIQQQPQLRTLFSGLQVPGCDQHEGASLLIGQQSHQTFKPSSRMARFPDSAGSLGDIQQLRQQLQQQTDLRETIQRIRRVLTVGDVYKTVVKTLMEFFQADWILLLENGPCYWRSVESSLCNANCNSSNALNAYLGLESVTTKLSQPFPITVDYQSVQNVPVDQQWLSQFPGAWLLGPIHLPKGRQVATTESLWGIVAIGRKDRTNIWTEEQLEQAKVLLDEIAIALHHSLLYEQLRQDNRDLRALALTDSLTGLANRRQFDHYFEAEWNRLAREQQPLTLILCDIDYFKRYNDYYGHPTGDVCLAKVSDVLTYCIRRPADLVARYGGEEFAVILPNTDTAGGHSVASAIQDQLAKAAIPHVTSGAADTITLTMGIATVIPQHQLSSQDLLQAADLALYHAKQQGRDRIYVHAHYYVHDDTRTKNTSLNVNQLIGPSED